jgi:cob(I)alamin adenosyltransferase
LLNSLDVAKESPGVLPSEKSTKGLVLVFTGDGKGKTSAALGIALRAAGHGLRVHIVFFMKGEFPYGEQKALAELPTITISRFGFKKFVNRSDIKPEEKQEASKALIAARKAMLSLKYDVVVLDEVNVAASWKLIDVEEVLQLIKDKPENVNLILTGRYADPRVIKAADLVTEMVKIKHPYDNGVLARKGIDV